MAISKLSRKRTGANDLVVIVVRQDKSEVRHYLPSIPSGVLRFNSAGEIEATTSITSGGGGGGGSSIDLTITSWANLQAEATASLDVPVVKQFIESSTNILRTAVLKAGTDATDAANGIYRPNDYNAGTNAKVWYNVGH